MIGRYDDLSPEEIANILDKSLRGNEESSDNEDGEEGESDAHSFLNGAQSSNDQPVDEDGTMVRVSEMSVLGCINIYIYD